MSPTYSVCADHGYIAGEHFNCPTCGKKTEVYSRITGYYRPVKNWNNGKSQEFKDRKVYDISRSTLKRAGAAGSPVSVESHVKKAAPSGELMLFATRTCPNCKVAESMLNKAGISVRKVIAEENPDLATRYGIRQAPTLVIDDGADPLRLVGLSEIKAFIKANPVAEIG